jgi:F0F1-type ATP synthase epsilon subunit
MADVLTLKVVSTKGTLLEKKVEKVTLPTLTGEVCILPNHCKYVALLSGGDVYYSESGSTEEGNFSIKEGSAKFEDNRLLLISES